MDSVSQNELDARAMGGTELMGMRLQKYADPELLEQAQVIRSRYRGLDESKKVHIFWTHDLANDPESAKVFTDEALMAKFDAFVFVSHWQLNSFREAFMLVRKNLDKCCVILNTIEPFLRVDRRVASIDKDLLPWRGLVKVKMIYTSTPHRGLEILVPVFEQMAAQFPGKFHLDVYSSFKLYGWEERDKPYQSLFARIDQHPDMTNHGTVSNDEIRAALMNSDILAYPSIWEETSCLCLIEAMSAKVFPVTVDLAAIGETTGHMTGLIPSMDRTNKYQSQAQFANQYRQALTQMALTLLTAPPAQRAGYDNMLDIIKAYADLQYSPNAFGAKWNALILSIIQSHGVDHA